MTAPAFPNYTQLRQIVPIRTWHVLRVASVACALGLVVLLFVDPDTGLDVWWGYTVPVLPLVFFAAPGLWRNLCPMAALNQTPRLFRFSRGLTLPPVLKEYGYVVGIVIFLVVVPTRKVLFNHNGAATGLLLLGMLGLAFAGGVVFKGKGGWCSSGVCPLFPAQRVYGQTPFALIPNSHCQPCVGCAKNCYDFNPSVAYLADMNDDDQRWAGYRKFFAGAFPGLILAFYRVPTPPAISRWRMYGEFAVYVLASVGVFSLLERFVKITAFKLTTVFGAAALNLYYWYNIPLLTRRVLDRTPDGVVWGGRTAVFAATLVWIWRSYQKERVFLAQLEQTRAPARLGTTSISLRGSQALRRSKRLGAPEVVVQPDGQRIVAAAGRCLLDVAEANGLSIEAGCRMGICGADPIAVLEGMSNLAPVDDDERNTLERLGLAANTRLACKAHVFGDCTIALKPERPKAFTSSVIRGARRDPDVNTVVIIGNGIAGVTAADHVRRRHPAADIHLVARERHHLYNRMGIERLVYGRTAMGGLYLQEDRWYDDLAITTWLNTRAVKLDRVAKQVALGTGETLTYDRLILATGARSMVPPITGFGLPGTFVMREADDALAMRAYAQEHGCRHALVAGGGLLGLEAAHALHRLGLEVSVLERSEGLLRRQLDQRAASMVREYLEGLGLTVVTRAETDAVLGDDRVREAVLKDGRRLPCDLLLVAAGIVPNAELARDAGLDVAKGVIVDDELRTVDPHIYAIGDVAEHRGVVHGLWPAAAEQAQVAAVNALGEHRRYEPVPAATMLKVVGVDLTSVGRVEASGPDELDVAIEDVEAHRYRKLVVAQGRLIGAILLGYAELAPMVTKAVREGADVSPVLEALRAGRWDGLAGLPAGATPTPARPVPRLERPPAPASASPPAPVAEPAGEPVGEPVSEPVRDVSGSVPASAPVDGPPAPAGGPSVPRILVRVVAGPAKGVTIALTTNGGSLGRAPENDVSVADAQVSRHHAAITWHDGQFWIADLGSANGTSLNFAAITAEAALRTGDVIGIGDSRLVVTIG